jgi:GT2 family glycosyltransferase
VIVVDNGSTDNSTKIVASYVSNFPNQFILITLATNRGTTYPRNLALQNARGRAICILDSDTEILEGNLQPVLDRLSSDRAIGILAPRLVLPDGNIQISVKLFPTMMGKLLKIPSILFGLKLKHLDYYADFPFTVERDVDCAIAACWFFRRDLVSDIGMLDEQIFYAPEDVEFCFRVWKYGLRVKYLPSISVMHHTQQISHRRPFSRISLSHLVGLWHFFRKHGGWFLKPDAGNNG